MSLEVSKESKKQKALDNLKKGRELRAKKLAEKKELENKEIDEMNELDDPNCYRIKKEFPPDVSKPIKQKLPKPETKIKKIELIEDINIPIDTPIIKPKKQYKPKEPKIIEVEKIIERVIYEPPPLKIQFY
jgi:hypothetical protein